jgi:hypothetical protein
MLPIASFPEINIKTQIERFSLNRLRKCKVFHLKRDEKPTFSKSGLT